MNKVYTGTVVDFILLKKKLSVLWIILLVLESLVGLKIVAFVFSITIVSSVFLDEEKGVRAFYFTPVSRKSSVLGRYIFYLTLFIICLSINICLDVIVPMFYDGYISGNLYFYLTMFALFLLLTSIEIPLLYWKSYAQVRIIQNMILLLALICAAKMLNVTSMDNTITLPILNFTLLFAAILGAATLFLISIFISCKIYLHKDL